VFLTLITFGLFIFFLLSSLSIFPYYSYFDEKGNFFIRKYFFFRKQIDLSEILRVSIEPIGSIQKFMYVIDLWTNTKIIPIRTAGIFSYKSNIELLKRIWKEKPKISMKGQQIEKYFHTSNNKGVLMLEEHQYGYFFLISTFLLFILLSL